MPVGTYDAYVERLKKMKPNIYLHGKKVDRTGDFMKGGLFVIKETYDCANDPKYEDVCTATSHLTGERSTVSAISTSQRKTCLTSSA